MATDRTEAQKRSQSLAKTSTKHPIAAIEKRILDSAAYADLAFSSRAVLVLLCRNLEKNRNGHIQLSETQAAGNGIERKTLRRAFSDLIAHQLIVMTWRGGKVQGSCNKYALTWMPIKDRKGIHADHFKLESWRDWKPVTSEKTGYRKSPLHSAQNVPLKAISSPKISPTPGDKKGPIEVIAIPNVKTPLYRAATSKQHRQLDQRNSPRLLLNAGKGLLRLVA
jgi:hypothetical protein